jgi:FkbM family methyltransferase
MVDKSELNVKSRLEKLRLAFRGALRSIALKMRGSSENIYYNETSNDRWIVEHIFPGLRGGYFLEAGAANGKAASSCYILEKELGWTGICIEPHTRFFEQLKVNRPNSICLNLCLSDKPGSVLFIEGDEDSLSPYLSGIERNLVHFKHGGNEISKLGRKVEKQAVTLASVLASCRAPQLIDYAAFDIEGSELEVLREFPFEHYKFRAISMECDGKIWNEVTGLLQSNGYQEVKNPFNSDKPWERYFLLDGLA